MAPRTQRSQLPYRLVSAFLVPLLLGAATGCTTSSNDAAVVASLVGKTVLPEFDHQAVRELTIAKADPASGDRWTARVVRETEDPELWKIALAPDGRRLQDDRADGTFILHFLDTLHTLQLAEAAGNATPDHLGLSPPRFLLKLRLPGQEAPYELWFGAAAPGESSAFGRVTAPELHPAIGRDWVFRGAAVKMLDFLPGFEALRLRRLATFSADDVDELELKARGRSTFYAQRDGDAWTGRGHRRLKREPEVADFLARIAHARIREFIDDEEVSRRLAPLVSEKPAPLYEVIVKSRGRATSLRFAWENGLSGPRGNPSLLASISTRPGAVFRLFPEMIRPLRTMAGMTHPRP